MSEISDKIIKQLKKDKKRFWASDNISDYLSHDDKEKLIEELTGKFDGVLKSLIIDTDNDPNSMETSHRMAKMYINEIMSGRYTKEPKVASFPNDDPNTRYSGILNVRAEITSMCSHHHQPVKGLCFIGIVPATKVIGLSKYARIAQHCARRGTLQEELARVISDEIREKTGSNDVGVHIIGKHGCMENRGVCAHDSTTQTTILSGQFFNPSVKDEWMDYIKMQMMGSIG